MQEFLIVANSPLLTKDIILQAKIGKKILALDGSASILHKYSITPDVILGDFDSIDSDAQSYYGIKPIADYDSEYWGKQGVLIVPAPDQNYTDLEKAIMYCDKKNASSITIVGATGGREDHHEALKIALKTYYKSIRPILVHGDYGSMCYVENEFVRFNGSPGEYCGFILQGCGSVISEGLEYQCRGHAYSTSNKMLGTNACFYVTGCALLFLPLQIRP